MRKTTLQIFAVLLITLSACFGVAAEEYGGHHSFKAEITGKQAVPPVETTAKGEAVFGITKGDELTYKITLADIENVTAAHIHIGKMGKNGGPVAGLFAGPKKEGKFSGTLSEGTITSKELLGPLAGKSVKDLIGLIKSGDAYVNVHTDKYPDGEIRGQIK
jgi:hypothetical protein